MDTQHIVNICDALVAWHDAATLAWFLAFADRMYLDGWWTLKLRDTMYTHIADKAIA